MTLSWLGIVRLGLVQMALGAVVVLMTSTLNRVMVVELALPAILPGLLVGLHYGVQLSRPVWGHRSDAGGNRTRWIRLGMAMLAGGGVLAALGVMGFGHGFTAGLALSVPAYVLIGLGAGACGTSVLALLAAGCAPRRRPAAATITWLMMILGIAATAGAAGGFLDPYSPARLLAVVATVAAGAMAVTLAATAGLERGLRLAAPGGDRVPFRAALAEAWADPRARLFTIFVFLSMVAYFMQELILEPYGGLVFGLSPGETTRLSGSQHAGVFLGMLTVGIAATGLRLGALRSWVVGGCLASAAALLAIAAIGQTGADLLTPAVMALGFANGVFAVAAIGAMMELAGEGRGGAEGTRMGLWGAAQAIAAGAGGFAGAAAADALRLVLADAPAFGTVFAVEAALFVAAAALAARIMDRGARARPAAAVLLPGE